MPLPDPVSVQLARLYTYVVHDRCGERAALNLPQRTLEVELITRREPAGDPRALLRASMLSALNRTADAQEARGHEALANWYMGWARWFSELGVSTVRGDRRTNSLAWARGQRPTVLKTEVVNRMTRLIDLVSLTPIQLP